MMLGAAQAGDWRELNNVEMSPENVQYLSVYQKSMITGNKTLFEKTKSEKEIDDDQVTEIEKVLSNFEGALTNLE